MRKAINLKDSNADLELKISELELIQNRLKASEARFQDLSSGIDEAFWIWEDDNLRSIDRMSSEDEKSSNRDRFTYMTISFIGSPLLLCF